MNCHLLIPTHGRRRLLARTLESLTACELPSSLASIVIVENGAPAGARQACQRVADRLPIHYRWAPEPSKSAALNLGVAEIRDDDLVVMSDDDVVFEQETLAEYARAAGAAPRGWFFGGPFAADYEQAPPPWLTGFLPPSAVGWDPDPDSFDASKDRFFGCNWAAYARDLRAAGGFDLQLGPGTAKNATGEEFQMQRRLHRAGLRSRLLPSARVRHYVPIDRCSPEWALARSHRNGLAKGIAQLTRDWRRAAIYHAMNGIRYSAATAAAPLAVMAGERHRFRAEFHRRKASGYFEGFYAGAADCSA